MMILKNFYQISLELADDKKTSYILGKNNKFSQRMDGDGRIFKNKEDADSFFNEIEIPCYVLEDGTRVLSGRAMQNALGFGKNSSGQELQKIAKNPNLTPYFSPVIYEAFENRIDANFIKEDGFAIGVTVFLTEVSLGDQEDGDVFYKVINKKSIKF